MGLVFGNYDMTKENFTSVYAEALKVANEPQKSQQKLSDLESRIDVLEKQNALLIKAIKKFLEADGNDMCHENRQELAIAIGIECPVVKPLPWYNFFLNCFRYRMGLSFIGCRSVQNGKRL